MSATTSDKLPEEVYTKTSRPSDASIDDSRDRDGLAAEGAADITGEEAPPAADDGRDDAVVPVRPTPREGREPPPPTDPEDPILAQPQAALGKDTARAGSSFLQPSSSEKMLEDPKSPANTAGSEGSQLPPAAEPFTEAQVFAKRAQQMEKFKRRLAGEQDQEGGSSEKRRLLEADWSWPNTTALEFRRELADASVCVTRQRCSDTCTEAAPIAGSLEQVLLACYADIKCVAVMVYVDAGYGHKCHCLDTWSRAADAAWTHCPRVTQMETADADEVTLVAGMMYTSLVLEATGYDFDAIMPLAQATVKLVEGDANKTDCATRALDVPMNGLVDVGGGHSPADMSLTEGPLLMDIDSDKTFATFVKLSFMHGGLFRLCYTPDVAKDNLVPARLRVLGVRSDCGTDDCLRHERWECYFVQKGQQRDKSCLISVAELGGRDGWNIEVGAKSAMTWSAAWPSDIHDAAGARLGHGPVGCASSMPDDSALETTPSGGFFDMDGTTTITMPSVREAQTSPLAVALCYCPSYNKATYGHCDAASGAAACCDEAEEYIQHFGSVYFWTMRICDVDSFTSCTAPYMRVVPQQKFVLRVDCPPGSCERSGENRVKLIDYTESLDLQSWEAATACRTMRQTAVQVWTNASLVDDPHGGIRQDYKAWHEQQLLLTTTLGRDFDVCFCNSNCRDSSAWFKVGQVRSSASFALASKLPGQSLRTVAIAGVPGTMGLYGGIQGPAAEVSPYESPPYSGRAVMNILSYDHDASYWKGSEQLTLEQYFDLDREMPEDFQELLDSECQREVFGGVSALVAGIATPVRARDYVAQVDEDDTVLSNYFNFAGHQKDQNFTVDRPGVIALCYCAMLNETQDECADPAYWLFAGRLTVKGPRGGLDIIMPTGFSVGLHLSGWGFGAGDRLRIAEASQPTCAGPGASIVASTRIRTGCPSEDGTSCGTAHEHTELETLATSSLSSGVLLVGASAGLRQTTLTFGGSVAGVLNDGDVLTIGLDEILVNGRIRSAMSADELYQAQRLSGEIEFQDDVTQTYLVGHRVTLVRTPGTEDVIHVTIPLGFADIPAPAFTFSGQAGTWQRRNSLASMHNVKASSAVSGLKLCWGVHDSAAGVTTYYSEAAKLHFVEPPSMADAYVKMTAPAPPAYTAEQAAIVQHSRSAGGSLPAVSATPIILSFRPSTYYVQNVGASAAAGTMLKIRFKDLDRMAPVWSSAEVAGSMGTCLSSSGADTLDGYACRWEPIAPMPDSAEVSASSMQAATICGQLFTELWSSDSRAFPALAGCYYGRSYQDNADGSEKGPRYRDLHVVLEAGHSLKPDVTYQFVMNAYVQGEVDGVNLIDINAMCAAEDACERPYKVFERGYAVVEDAVAVSAIAAYPRMEVSPKALQTVLFRIAAKPAKPAALRRPQQDVVAVIDVSESMGKTGKLDLAKVLLKAVVADMQAHDRFHLVPFHETAALTIAHAAAHEQARLLKDLSALQTVSPGRTLADKPRPELTDMVSGFRILEQLARDPNRRSATWRLVFISDGHASLGASSRGQLMDKVDELQQFGIVTSVFGVGADQNRGLLQSMAEAGHGQYSAVLSHIDATAAAKQFHTVIATGAKLWLSPLQPDGRVTVHGHRRRGRSAGLSMGGLPASAPADSAASNAGPWHLDIGRYAGSTPAGTMPSETLRQTARGNRQQALEVVPVGTIAHGSLLTFVVDVDFASPPGGGDVLGYEFEYFMPAGRGMAASFRSVQSGRVRVEVEKAGAMAVSAAANPSVQFARRLELLMATFEDESRKAAGQPLAPAVQKALEREANDIATGAKAAEARDVSLRPLGVAARALLLWTRVRSPQGSA
eukprot:TRINITY_DN19242_c0_g1_i5.p1 TRINITY_DN19242_c0_g1~~TRINITY_DN19242_c0_g1_i5.p1  ORF type:complete len:2054 (+),score=488.83 TRINITY_DN19242_c0_g1_i5:653-6163(+)